MSKQKTTKKFLKENYHIINAGNGNLQTLLQFENADYYCTRTEGWACDAYIFGDYVILDGYDCIGKTVSYDIMKKYNDKAKAIFNKYNYSDSKYWTYNRMISTYRKMIQKFIKEVS
jgi:hypothetical protein|nr:MAG TPA: hypothetical protein [Bacteriophage sp.]